MGTDGGDGYIVFDPIFTIEWKYSGSIAVSMLQIMDDHIIMLRLFMQTCRRRRFRLIGIEKLCEMSVIHPRIQRIPHIFFRIRRYSECVLFWGFLMVGLMRLFVDRHFGCAFCQVSQVRELWLAYVGSLPYYPFENQFLIMCDGPPLCCIGNINPWNAWIGSKCPRAALLCITNAVPFSQCKRVCFPTGYELGFLVDHHYHIAADHKNQDNNNHSIIYTLIVAVDMYPALHLS